MALRVLVIMGTRPEAIKLAPVCKALRKFRVDVVIVNTGQHPKLVGDVLEVFGLVADEYLTLYPDRDKLAFCFVEIITALDWPLEYYYPDWVIVQGDTTSALAGALAAFYNQVKLAHVEAGLRTNDLSQPYPEEGNRRMISQIATLNFAPTEQAAQNVPGAIVTGNTVVDALQMIPASPDNQEKYILVTAHRRENWGVPLQRICKALRLLGEKYPVVFAVHPNPQVKDTVYLELDGYTGVTLLDAPDYVEFVNLIRGAYFILTDSGGIQEEAPTFGVPVVVLRNTTERPEALENGFARLAGTQVDDILAACNGIDEWRAAIKNKPNPFGDGAAANRIVEALIYYGK